MTCTYSCTVIRNLPRNCSWLVNCFLLEPPLRSGNPDCTDPILASIPNIMPICSGYATSREVGDKTGYTNHYARTGEQDNWWPFLACRGRVKVVVTIHGLKVFTCREIWFPSTRLLLLAVCICPGTSMGVSHFAKRYKKGFRIQNCASKKSPHLGGNFIPPSFWLPGWGRQPLRIQWKLSMVNWKPSGLILLETALGSAWISLRRWGKRRDISGGAFENRPSGKNPRNMLRFVSDSSPNPEFLSIRSRTCSASAWHFRGFVPCSHRVENFRDGTGTPGGRFCLESSVWAQRRSEATAY